MTPAPKKKTKKLTEAAELRQRAEALFNLNFATKGLSQSKADTQRLLHELQVHQIELEMQNEELQQTRTEVEAGLQQFTELYDFAPVGYITLASDGMIKQVNLRGASLIGTERSRLVGSNFNLFVASADLPVLNTFLKNVFNSGSKESCELNLCKRDSQRITPDLFDHRSNPETFLCVVRIEAELADVSRHSNRHQ